MRVPAIVIRISGLVILLILVLSIYLPGTETTPNTVNAHKQMNRIAKEFIVLAFCLSKTDKHYVDAYFGPQALKEKSLKKDMPLDNILKAVQKLSRSLHQLTVSNLSPDSRLRHRFLSRLIQSMATRIKLLSREKLSFDEESEGLYNIILPDMKLSEFYEIRKKLEAILPGKGDLENRMKLFREQFTVPPEKVEAVFRAALKEAKQRTRKWLPLRPDEQFILELVNNQSWLAYNWFKGNGRSLIQINTDIPLSLEQVIDLACHEGYPGHHVFHGFLEKTLYREKGWLEFSIYPLFSPLSVISEGLANFGIELAFPEADRLKFESEILCPLAGINPKNLELYHRVLKYVKKLKYARNLIARDFLNEKISSAEAIELIRKLLLRSLASARQSLEFVKIYRSYILTYSIGEDLVRNHILSKAGKANPEQQWKEYLKLMTRPVLPEQLQAGSASNNSTE
jgi:hypothetical protein